MSSSDRVVVVVEPAGRADRFGTVAAALDAQTLPATEFEVALVGPHSERVADWARRRPNVQLFPDVAAAVAGVDAEWVALPREGDVLRPAALEKLRDRARATGADAVLGRVDAGAAAMDDLLAADAGGVQPSPETVDRGVPLVRRDLLVQGGTDTREAIIGVLATTTLSTVAHQCARRTAKGAAFTADTGAPVLERTAARWDDGLLVVIVGGRVDRSAADTTDPPVVVATARGAASGSDVVLPCEGETRPDGSFEATIRIDPTTAADGKPLWRGRWVVTVGVHGRRSAVSGRALIPAVADLANALIDDQCIVIESGGPNLVLDVGPTKTSFVGALRVADVSITEDHRGTLFSAPVPGVATAGASTHASVLIDKFTLPATLLERGGGVRLECWLSAMAGRFALASHVTLTAPLGLDLVVGETGTMTVEPAVLAAAARPDAANSPSTVSTPARAAAREAAPQRAAVSGTPAENDVRGRSRVQRIRSALPSALEPAVQAASRNRLARSVYRRAAGLSDR